MTQLKINVILLLITFMINSFCYSQTILGYMYSDNKNVFFAFEERRRDTLLIYSLAALSFNKTDTLKINNYFYLNDFHSGTITKDINYFIDKYEYGIISTLWLFYEPFQIDSTKNIIVKIISKQMFLIKNHSLYVQNKNKSITLFTDFKKLKINRHIQQIKADAKYDINSDDYVVENTFGDLLLDSFYNCFRINKNYHITAYKLGKEWYFEIKE